MVKLTFTTLSDFLIKTKPKNMKWKEVSLSCNKKNLDLIESFATNLGACSISYLDAKDQPILEPKAGENPLWDDIVLVALFTEEYDIEDIKSKVQTQFSRLIKNIDSKEYEDQDWTRTWMDDFKPMTFGKRLIVSPSWDECGQQKDKVHMVLDPGLAFGTGTHPTTSLCLQWLDENVSENDDVIDYGCGSGILAIAAKLLGGNNVMAIDNDPQAILAATDNAKKNNIDTGFQPMLSQDFGIQVKADIVIANILAGILIQLYDTISNHVNPSGKLALSGILKEQTNEVIEVYSKSFDILSIEYDDDWAIISGIKKCSR